jgi:hypothetical protein
MGGLPPLVLQTSGAPGFSLELFENFSFSNNNRLKMHVSQPIGEKLQRL